MFRRRVGGAPINDWLIRLCYHRIAWTHAWSHAWQRGNSSDFESDGPFGAPVEMEACSAYREFDGETIDVV